MCRMISNTKKIIYNDETIQKRIVFKAITDSSKFIKCRSGRSDFFVSHLVNNIKIMKSKMILLFVTNIHIDKTWRPIISIKIL